MPKPASDAQLADLADAVLELAHRLDSRELRDLVPLTGTEVAVIREVHRHPHSSPTQIAEAVGLQRSNVSTALRTLEVGGLVVRQKPAGNARAVEIVPTELAAESVEKIKTFWSARLRQAPEELLTEAVAALGVLNKIADSITD